MASMWKCRNVLVLSGIPPGARYNLPFFAHQSLGSIMFKDEDGRELRYCEDAVYRAVDHRLLWLCYSRLEESLEFRRQSVRVRMHVADQPLGDGLLSNPEDVLIIADVFCDETKAHAAKNQWRALAEEPDLPPSVTIDEAPEALPNSIWCGCALWVDPRNPIVLGRRLPMNGVLSRMQLRAYFYDFGNQDAHHWVGFTARPAAFALGVNPSVEGHYGCFCSQDDEYQEWGGTTSWQLVKAERTVGWHLFEFVLQEKWLNMFVDGEAAGSIPLKKLPAVNEDICLGASGGGCGIWGLVELLHTPLGDSRWDVGVRNINRSGELGWEPWTALPPEEEPSTSAETHDSLRGSVVVRKTRPSLGPRPSVQSTPRSAQSSRAIDVPQVMMHVDWQDVDARLPSIQIPRQKAERRRIFTKLDLNCNGFLSLSEAMAGLPCLLERQDRKRGEFKHVVPLDDFKPSVRRAFHQAKVLAPPRGKTKKDRQQHKEKVDIREFHALLVAFRYYLELDVIFESMDGDEDRRVDWKNCKAFLPVLAEWGITKEDAKSKFPTSKDTMDYDDFADWCIEKRFGSLDLELDENDAELTLKDAVVREGMEEMLRVFRQWDADKSGCISEAELAGVLMALDRSFTRQAAHELFRAMDADSNGNVDYTEFAVWLCS